MKDEDVVSEEEFRVLLIEVTEWTVLKWKGVVVEELMRGMNARGIVRNLFQFFTTNPHKHPSFENFLLIFSLVTPK